MRRSENADMAGTFRDVQSQGMFQTPTVGRLQQFASLDICASYNTLLYSSRRFRNVLSGSAEWIRLNGSGRIRLNG